MEKLAKLIANKISVELNYDEEKSKIIAYGLFALIQTLTSILTVFLIGLILHIAIEALIICFSVSILRKYSGGAHASSAEFCTIFGILACITFSYCVKNYLLPNTSLYILLAIVLATYFVSYLLVYKYAPVDSPVKPIKTDKKKARMRKGSFTVLTIYFSITALFVFIGQQYTVFNGFALCLCTGMVWQVFTLTKIGRFLLNSVDFIFYKIFSSSKGGE